MQYCYCDVNPVVIRAATCPDATCYVLRAAATAAVNDDGEARETVSIGYAYLTMPCHRSPRGYVRQYHLSVSFVSYPGRRWCT